MDKVTRILTAIEQGDAKAADEFCTMLLRKGKLDAIPKIPLKVAPSLRFWT